MCFESVKADLIFSLFCFSCSKPFVDRSMVSTRRFRFMFSNAKAMPAPPFIRLICRCNLVKCSRGKLSVRSVAYTTTTTTTSPDTNVLQKVGGKFKVFDHFHWKRERSSALLFARQVKKSGFNHDVETYMAIVRLLCTLGMEVRLNHLFMYVIENKVEISDLLEAFVEENLIKAVDVLVKVYASVGMFQEAMHTLSEMKSRAGLMVSTRTCNFVINELIEWGHKVDMIESVYIQLRMKGLIPNVYTYGILMKGYCRKGRFMEAGSLFSQMALDGVEPNAFITGAYIHAISRPDFAFRALKVFRDHCNRPVDAFAYACVIRGFVKESRLQDAEEVFLDMKLRGVVPDADCYGALIQGYRQKGDTDKAAGVRKEMESRLGIHRADYVLARSMMQRLCGLGRSAEALSKFKGFMQSGVFLDRVMFNMAIDAACKLGKMDDAMELVQGMEAREMKPCKMHYRTLMNGYCFKGEPWNALYIFHEMMRNGLRPDSTTYHLLASGGVILPLHMLFK